MLSVVIVSRNDGYGGNLIQRASYCINSFLYHADEVIYVDWNSPNSTLIEDIPINDSYKHKLKLIPIRSDFINQLPEPPKQQCCEVLGRNIGIRRASGDWILSTNIDIITTPIPTKNLDKNKYYNLERHNLCLEQLMTEEWDNNRFYDYTNYSINPDLIINWLTTHKDKFPGFGRGQIDEWDIWAHWKGCGDFQLAHRDCWEKVKGFEESMTGRNFADGNLNKKMIQSGFELIDTIKDCMIFHINHVYNDYYDRSLPHAGGGTGDFNDVHKYMRDFQNTENKDTWGFSNKNIEIISYNPL